MWILPTCKSIYEWDRTLRENGSFISKTGKHSKKHVAEMTVGQVRESFARSPSKSIRQISRELQIPRSTVHKFLRKRLRMRAYKLQLLHQLKPDYCRKRANFCDEMIRRIDENPRKVRNLIDLRHCIIQAVKLITPDMLVNTWREVEYHFSTCRAINGAHEKKKKKKNCFDVTEKPEEPKKIPVLSGQQAPVLQAQHANTWGGMEVKEHDK
ncbi:hypothetical protein ANN_03237 [Periplaneta americana]|uniref:HTH iclR-type domain-containing protein n=1 Tax=Periplaneta americana TaxID=6978 RepID=A0ABQ8TYK9_PERAM|nr:hypothetical protein ANN_03237 [Periplaneta americana]